MKAGASTVTMKIFKKVSITLSAIDLDFERAPGGIAG